VNKKLIFSALVAGAALTSTSLSAQVSKNAGLMLNVHAQGAGLAVEDGETETGFGGGITAGYGFSENLGLYLTLDGANMNYGDADEDTDGDTYTLGQLDLGLRYTFGNTASALRPYLNAGVSGVTIVDEIEVGSEATDIAYTGPAGTFGAGIQYFISPSLAIDGGIQASIGKFTKFKVDGDEVDFDGDEDPSFTATRVQVGLTWHP
jgi:outer membrane protein W